MQQPGVLGQLLAKRKGTSRRVRLTGSEEAGSREEPAAKPAHVALAWLLSKGDDIVPISGSKRIARLEESTVADQIHLSPSRLRASTT